MAKQTPRIYLDNAATSWPKPPAVLQAVSDFYNDVGSAAGRGASNASMCSNEIVQTTRRSIAEYLNAADANEIIFCNNGTDALNKAIFGFVNDGDHIITTTTEHNSVLRPLSYLKTHRNCVVTQIPCDGQGAVDLQKLEESISSETSLLVVNHASNVTGTIQQVREIGQLAARHDVLFLLDAAQTLGATPVNVQAIGCHLLAAPGHKGLLGPLGTGILYINHSIAEQVRPIIFGGTGTNSASDIQPEKLPEKFESGNLNVPAIAGLGAGLNFLLSDQAQLLATQHRDNTHFLFE